MRRLAILAALCVPAARAQSADALLERARQAMRERLENTPNYTCLLELDRLVYPGGATASYRSKELFRLEVSVVGGREHFAWPGAARTRESLEEMLGPGLSSTGEFSAHGRTTLLDARSSIEPLPDARQDRDGHTGYSYSVPLAASRYAVAGRLAQAFAPYEGELWIDETTAQLASFAVQVERPPAQSNIGRIDSFVRYERVKVSGLDAWLPARARVTVENAGGQAFRNELRFTGCRAFQAEATIRFDAESLDASEASGPVRHVEAPAALELSILLDSGFDSERTRAGDAVHGRLLEAAGPLPKGARISGRVKRLAVTAAGRGPGARRVTPITLELAAARWQGHCAPLRATLQRIDKLPKLARVNPDGLRPPPAFFKSERALGYQASPRMTKTGSGAWVVLGELYAIPAGAKMRWKTEQPPTEPCALR